MKESVFKKYLHNPPHLFIDDAWYFITGGILRKQHLLYDDGRKQIVKEAIEKWFAHFDWIIEAWIILSNHYHLMAKARCASHMPTIIGRVHGGSSVQINRLDMTPGRQVWWNYWDTCMRNERDFEIHLRYIYWNAVKHEVVSDPEDYLWSSFTQSKQSGENRVDLGNEPPTTGLRDNFDDF